MELVLFYGVPQGCSFGSIVTLEWLGAPYRLCRIEMMQRPWDPMYVRVNPHFQTPALLLESGESLTESMAIQLHLAARGMEHQMGFRQGTPESDRLNEMLAYLNTDFFSAFGALWTAYERAGLNDEQKTFLRMLGREKVAKQCAYLDTLLKDGKWLLGGTARTVADAYLSGIGRWVDYHRLFELPKEYPHLHQHLQKLATDPAVKFAQAIEDGHTATSGGLFLGHVTLEELRPRLAV